MESPPRTAGPAASWQADSPHDARRTIEVLREYFAERGLTRFVLNMDAIAFCRIDMHTGDLDAADAWYRKPGGLTTWNVMRLPVSHPGHGGAGGRQASDTVHDASLRAELHVQNCARIIDGIHLNILTAIALYRKKDEVARAIDGGAGCGGEYRFIRTVSVYGTAKVAAAGGTRLGWRQKSGISSIMAAVRKQRHSTAFPSNPALPP